MGQYRKVVPPFTDFVSGKRSRNIGRKDQAIRRSYQRMQAPCGLTNGIENAARSAYLTGLLPHTRNWQAGMLQEQRRRDEQAKNGDCQWMSRARNTTEIRRRSTSRQETNRKSGLLLPVCLCWPRSLCSQLCKHGRRHKAAATVHTTYDHLGKPIWHVFASSPYRHPYTT